MYVVDRLRITERDRRLLEFASRHRIVLPDQARVLLETSANAAATRLRTLARARLFDQQTFFDRQPRCYWITRRGLAAIGASLPAPRPDLRAYRHDVGLAWLWLAARGGAFGPLEQLVSEREMRSWDAAQAHTASMAGGPLEPFAVRLGGVGAGGRERLHYPDLLLIGGGGRRVAVELELSSKTRTRRERILAGYGADRRFDAVLYVVDSRSVARAIRSAAMRLGVSERVHVQGVSWGANEPRQAIGRARTSHRTVELAQ
jgi:hypothetical protein